MTNTMKTNYCSIKPVNTYAYQFMPGYQAVEFASWQLAGHIAKVYLTRIIGSTLSPHPSWPPP